MHHLITVWTYSLLLNIVLPTTGPVVTLQSAAWPTQAACVADHQVVENLIIPNSGLTPCEKTQILDR